MQCDLATSNLSLSPDDWISSLPLMEAKSWTRAVSKSVHPNLKVKYELLRDFSPLVIHSKQTDSINSQDPVAWFQLLTLGCRRVWDHCTDEDALHLQGRGLGHVVRMSNSQSVSDMTAPHCNVYLAVPLMSEG